MKFLAVDYISLAPWERERIVLRLSEDFWGGFGAEMGKGRRKARFCAPRQSRELGSRSVEHRNIVLAFGKTGCLNDSPWETLG